VLRSEYETVKTNGIPHQQSSGRSVPHTGCDLQRGDTPPQAPDYLILCVKVLPGVNRAALVKPWMGPATRLVLIENGIDIERELADAYPQNPLISCLAFIAASRTGPGEIEHKAYGKLVMGRFPDGLDDHSRNLAALSGRAASTLT